MTQQTEAARSASQEAERLITAMQEINASIMGLADRVVQVLSKPPVPPASD